MKSELKVRTTKTSITCPHDPNADKWDALTLSLRSKIKTGRFELEKDHLIFLEDALYRVDDISLFFDKGSLYITVNLEWIRVNQF